MRYFSIFRDELATIILVVIMFVALFLSGCKEHNNKAVPERIRQMPREMKEGDKLPPDKSEKRPLKPVANNRIEDAGEWIGSDGNIPDRITEHRSSIGHAYETQDYIIKTRSIVKVYPLHDYYYSVLRNPPKPGIAHLCTPVPCIGISIWHLWEVSDYISPEFVDKKVFEWAENVINHMKALDIFFYKPSELRVDNEYNKPIPITIYDHPKLDEISNRINKLQPYDPFGPPQPSRPDTKVMDHSVHVKIFNTGKATVQDGMYQMRADTCGPWRTVEVYKGICIFRD